MPQMPRYVSFQKPEAKPADAWGVPSHGTWRQKQESCGFTNFAGTSPSRQCRYVPTEALPLPTKSPPWSSLCPCVPSLRDSDSTELTGLFLRLNTYQGFTPGTGPGMPLSLSQCYERGFVPPRREENSLCFQNHLPELFSLVALICPPYVGHILKRLRVSNQQYRPGLCSPLHL